MPELIFDEENHLYFVDGRVIPSVTQILTQSGILDKRFFKAGAAERGTRIHSLCEQIANGLKPDEENGYTEAFRAFLKDARVEPAAVEHRAYSYLDFAGTIDLIAVFRGELVVIDIKTGVYQEWWSLQLAGYALLLENENIRRFSLEIKDTGKYKLTEYENNKEDINGFLNAFETYKQLYQGNFMADFC